MHPNVYPLKCQFILGVSTSSKFVLLVSSTFDTHRSFSRGERPGSQEDSTRSTPCFRENNQGYRCFFNTGRHGGVGWPGDCKWYHFSLRENFGTTDPFRGTNFSQLWREFFSCVSKSTGGVMDEKEYKKMRDEFSQILAT